MQQAVAGWSVRRCRHLRCRRVAEGLVRPQHAAAVATGGQLELGGIVALLQLGPAIPAGGGVDGVGQLVEELDVHRHRELREEAGGRRSAEIARVS